MNSLSIITIGTARQLLIPESREYVRAKLYAAHTASLFTIVLTRREHGFVKPIHDGNLHVYPTNSKNRLHMLIDAFILGVRIAREEKKKGSCVISSQDPLEIGWLTWKVALVTHIPFHIQVHGDYFSSNAWCGHSPLRFLRRVLARVLMWRARAIRVVSLRIKESLVTSGIAEEKITVLPIRPELEAFFQKSHTFNNTEAITFLSLGRLAPEKNISRIIRAFSRVHAHYQDVHLRIVGDGPELKKIASLIATVRLTDAVTLVPWTSDVPHEMSETDVFLLASLHEAYALTLVEAMASGIPVVTTDVGCVGDVVKNDVHGLVVYAQSDEAYAEAMERMVTDVAFRKICGELAREKAYEVGSSLTPDSYAGAWVTAISQAL